MGPRETQAGRPADAYRLLAECYAPPDENLPRIIEGLAQIKSEALAEVVRMGAGVKDVEALLVDHARLFVGPFHLLAPAYGSMYLEDETLMGNSTADVLRWYHEEGVEVAFANMPDHVIAELEFMYVLIRKETDALEDGDAEQVGACRLKQRSFLSTHLGTWVAAFADRVRQSAQVEFYRALAGATERFVLEDLESLRGGQAADEDVLSECQPSALSLMK